MATYKMTGGLIDNTQRRSVLQPRLTPDGKRVGATTTTAGATGSGTPSAPTTPQTFTNTAQTNPDMQAALKEYQDRIAQQKAREGQVDPLLMEQVEALRSRRGVDQSQRATERAQSGIRDYAAGQKSAAASSAARMGRPQGFRDALIDEASQRNAARASADIQMNELQRQDNLVLGGSQIMGAPASERLAREAGVTGLVAGQAGQAAIPANLALAQQGLGLNTWQAMQSDQRQREQMAQQERQQQQEMMLALIRSGGYY